MTAGRCVRVRVCVRVRGRGAARGGSCPSRVLRQTRGVVLDEVRRTHDWLLLLFKGLHRRAGQGPAGRLLLLLLLRVVVVMVVV